VKSVGRGLGSGLANGKTRIVVRAPNWIGDQVMAYPFFLHLRERYPQAHIAVACVPWVESIQFKNLVDEVIVIAPPKKSPENRMAKGWARWRAKLRTLEQNAKLLKKAGPWDIGISLPNSFSAAWIFYRAGVKDRRGYDADARGWLLNKAVPLSEAQGDHRAQSYLRLIEGMGEAPLNVDVFQKFDPAIAWPDTNPLACPGEKFWILAPGTTAESRRWPIEKFEALAERIAEKTNYVGVVIGGVAESAVAAKLCQNPKLRLQDWTQRGTVASYWKLFQQAQFTVCNDSGLAHVASLCSFSGSSRGSSAVYVIWGAGNPTRTKPLGRGKVNVITNPVECWPCEKNTCYQTSSKYLQCIRGIEVERVLESIIADKI